MKSNIFYNPNNPNQKIRNIISGIETTEPIKLVNKNNLSKEEQNALTELANNSNIVIKEVHKVNKFVILDREMYFERLVKHDHLDSNTNVKTDRNSDQQVFSKLNSLINKHAERLTKKEHKC